MKMLYIYSICLLITLSSGIQYPFLLANGPTYINSNNRTYFPYGTPKYDITVKLLQVDPYTGLWVMLLRGGPGSVLGIHRHYDQVYGYTLKGAWGYREHPEWLSKQGDLIHETPGSVHTLYIDENHGETEVLFFVWGALEYLDENGKTLYVEDWRSMLQRYINYSEQNNLPVEDLSYPKEKVPDVHFHHHEKSDL
jgi:quercetin dioxygenase-like cupin family protein